MTKTSLSDPLRIDTIALAEGGRIGLTFCPGKKQAHAASGSWDRDLATDLQAIRDWGAVTVLTFMEPQELEAHQVADLGGSVEALGMDWLQLPVRDGGVPGEGFEQAWLYAGHRLRSQLLSGRSVLLHCRGGLGRTGMIAVRLLIELGRQPEEAIAAVRAARPGAIETEAQLRYVLDQKPPAFSGAALDRHMGCLLGGAVGDALGAPVEFESLREIRRRFGPKGITEFDPAFDGLGEITDDTQMTLFTAEGLVLAVDPQGGRELVDPVTSLYHAYLRWYDTQGGCSGRSAGCDETGRPLGHGWLSSHKELWSRRAPGTSTLSALGSDRAGSIQHPINNSKGCGAVMRMAPVGLLPDRLLPARDPRRRVFSLACEVGAITHGHPTGYLSAAVFATTIFELAVGAPLREAMAAAVSELVCWPRHEETLAAVNAALRLAESGSVPDGEAVESLGGGWVAEEALAIALYAALVGETFRSGVELAVNHGGDSDSTGAIAGNLLGLMHGACSIPNGWARDVELRDVIVRVAIDLLELGEAA
jgi:ADP-ribosyl-[dinitrogen reductase] hydrolase